MPWTRMASLPLPDTKPQYNFLEILEMKMAQTHDVHLHSSHVWASY